MSHIKVFVKQFQNFISFIEDKFQDDTDIVTARIMITGLCSQTGGPELIIKAWKFYISDKYSSEIEKGDISFFISRDYSADISDKSEILKAIDKFRGPVNRLSDTDKSTVMTYIKQLTTLSNK